MRFEITRTSSRYDKPCDEAIEGRVPCWDQRTVQTPEEFDARFRGDPWLSVGTDHGFWREGTLSGIERRLEDRSAWLVDVPDLDALLALVDRYGEVVVAHGRGGWSLEIYDGYRE